MSELTTIARPYAKAAFDFAKDKKCIDKWFEMLNFLNVVLQDNYFISVKNSLSKSKLAELLIGICSKNIDRYFENFIKMLGKIQSLRGPQRLFRPKIYTIFTLTQHSAPSNVGLYMY